MDSYFIASNLFMQFLNRGKTQENVIYITADCFCTVLPREGYWQHCN